MHRAQRARLENASKITDECRCNQIKNIPGTAESLPGQNNRHASVIHRASTFFFFRWLHLLFNLGVQVVVGLPLEMVHGSLRIAAVYMAGVLAGE